MVRAPGVLQSVVTNTIYMGCIAVSQAWLTMSLAWGFVVCCYTAMFEACFLTVYCIWLEIKFDCKFLTVDWTSLMSGSIETCLQYTQHLYHVCNELGMIMINQHWTNFLLMWHEGFLLIFINSTRWDVMSMIVRESNSTFLLLTLGIHKSIKSIATSSHKVIFTAPLYVNNHSPCWTIYIHDNAHTWSCQWCIWAWDDDNVPALAVFHKITFFNGVHD